MSWISVNDSLPAPDQDALVSDGQGKILVARYRAGKWDSIPGCWTIYVVAWQPLPAPYRPAERLKAVTPPGP